MWGKKGKAGGLLTYNIDKTHKKIMRQVIIYPGEEGYWVAQCPSLPPCISQGKTKEEAIAIYKKE